METSVYIAMNRFEIATGREEVFEELWRSRDSYLEGVPGFREFHLLKGPAAETHTLYASHTVWDSEASFRALSRPSPVRRLRGRPLGVGQVDRQVGS
jgi:heme-degrading monooxygenase HmoA